MNNQIIFKDGNSVNNQSNKWAMEAGDTVATSGQPCILDSEHPYVIVAPDASPVIGTHYFVGFSIGTSNQTASADGFADLYSPIAQQTLLLPAKLASLISTQALYDTYVGTAVLFDLTAGVYTIDLASTGPITGTNGLLVMPMDISAYPAGVVAFIVRQSATFLN